MSPAARQTLGALIPVGIAILSFAISALGAWHNNDKELASRLAVIETRQEDDQRARAEVKAELREVRDKVDQIYRILISAR